MHSERDRFAPFREFRLLRSQGQPLSAGNLQQQQRARESGAPIALLVAPPAPWDLERWPSSALLASLGLALSQSVVALYCAEFGGGPLDRSLSGLRALDAYAALLAPSSAAAAKDARWLDRASVLVGAYLGETLRAVAGASWGEGHGVPIGPESYRLCLPGGSAIFPVRVARDRLSGSAAQSLHDYARRLTRGPA